MADRNYQDKHSVVLSEQAVDVFMDHYLIHPNDQIIILESVESVDFVLEWDYHNICSTSRQ